MSNSISYVSALSTFLFIVRSERNLKPLCVDIARTSSLVIKVTKNIFMSIQKWVSYNCKEILLKYVSSKFPNHEAWQASSLRSALYSWSLNRQHDEDTASGLVCVGGSGLLPEAGQPIQGVPEWSKETQVFWQQQTNMCVPWWNCSRQVQGKSSWNNK